MQKPRLHVDCRLSLPGRVERRICHAYSTGVKDIILWVYHFYKGRLAIADEKSYLTRPGGVWEKR